MIDEAQLALDYTFRQPELLQEALTHKSYLQGKQEVGQRDNERLEFLGDAVLAFVISEYVTSACPASREGELSKVKARLVSGHSLGQVAQRLKLGEWLRLGRGEEKTKGREKTSLLANALEAVIAAMYLDGGIEVARSFILRILQPELQGI
ncbi:MAG: ribonuclease III [Nitrospirota bacterium]|nr:MAG: ribonuclease III [Nitrospirota bacterium]